MMVYLGEFWGQKGEYNMMSIDSPNFMIRGEITRYIISVTFGCLLDKKRSPMLVDIISWENYKNSL
jgi:hypothetical protein